MPKMTDSYRRGYVAGLEAAARIADREARNDADHEELARRLDEHASAVHEECRKNKSLLIARLCRAKAKGAK